MITIRCTRSRRLRGFWKQCFLRRPGERCRYPATLMPQNRKATNPYDPTSATSSTVASVPKPRSLAKRIAWTFVFSLLLGVVLFFVFGFVGRTIALATLESDAYKQIETRYGSETARGLYIVYWAHNCGNKAFLAGIAIPWLHLYYSTNLRRPTVGNAQQRAG